LLRRDGFRVEYLGPDIPLEDLVDYARFENPAMIILSASLEHNAMELDNLQDKLARLRPAPLFGYGGRAFNRNAQLRQRIQGIFLGESIDEAIKAIHRLLNH